MSYWIATDGSITDNSFLVNNVNIGDYVDYKFTANSYTSSGKTGYLNGVKELSAICNIYVKGYGALTALSLEEGKYGHYTFILKLETDYII